MAFRYRFLDETQRRAQVEARLRDLESQHYATRIGVILSTEEENTKQQLAQAKVLEKQIGELGVEYDALAPEAAPDEGPANS